MSVERNKDHRRLARGESLIGRAARRGGEVTSSRRSNACRRVFVLHQGIILVKRLTNAHHRESR